MGTFSVTILILGTRTSFGIVYDGQSLAGYGERFLQSFDALLTEVRDTGGQEQERHQRDDSGGAQHGG